jgi:O-antigen/teichoic acid export membrane protein
LQWLRLDPSLAVPGFGATSASANFADWPFTYDDLEPFYTEVEQLYGVQGADGGAFANPFASTRSKPYPMTPGVAMYLGLKLADGARATSLFGTPLSPHAYPGTQASHPYDDRPPCNDCGLCSGFGCSINAKGTPLVSLRKALLSQRCQLRYNAQVVELVHAAGRVTAVKYVDGAGASQMASADAVVLAASPIESARLCLLSSIPSSSGQIGRNLMFHLQTNVNGFSPERIHGQRGRAVTHGISDFRGVEPGGEAVRVYEAGGTKTIALGGMRSAMTRFVAIDLADDDDAALRGTIAVGIAVSVGLAAILGIILFIAAPWVAGSVYGDPELVAGLRWVAVGLPSAAFTIVVLSATTGWRTMRPNAIVGSMFEPILRVVLTALALTLGAGLTGSLIMLQVASVIASVVAWIWLRRLMHGHARLKPVFHTGVLVRFGLVTWASSVALEGIRWADVQVLAVLTTADVVAEYQVATRTVLFCALAVNALTGALAPRAADLLRRGELSVVRRLYVTTSAILVRITLPLLMVVLVQADWLLTIFGRDYTGAAWISRILVFGVLFDTAVGAAGPILNMAGLQLYNLADNSGGLILNVTLNIILVPSFHGLGAAVAWTVTFFALGTARILQVKGKVLGVLPFSSPMWNMLIAAVVSGLVGFSLRLLVDQVWAVFPVAAIMIMVYFGVSILLGIGDDERWVARSLLKPAAALAA